MDFDYALLETGGGIDPVTSFGDRESLFEDLAEALADGSPPRLLAVYDLAGFEQYRQINGLAAGDQIVLRLARRVSDALGSRARCYRARADEFWALIDGSFLETQVLGEEVARALADEGRSADISASFGFAVLPDEAEEPMEALMIADRELGAARRARERRASRRPHDDR